MKRSIYFLLMIIVSFSILSCKKEVKNDLKENTKKEEKVKVKEKVKENDLMRLKLKGQVKYFEENKYEATEISGKYIKNENVHYQFYSFNKDGNILIDIDPNESETYKYYSNGNKKEISNQAFNINYVFRIIFIKKYDSLGNIIEYTGYDNENSVMESIKTLNIYDSKANLIEKKESSLDIWSKSFVLTKNNTYKYDSNGNLIEDNDLNKDGSLNSKKVYRYDSNGNLIEDNDLNKDGSLNSKKVYRYDSNGNLIEEFGRYPDGKFSHKLTYKYDSKGNKIEYCNFNSDGSFSQKITYKYDSNGKLIEEFTINTNINTIKETYTYDSKGNMIEKTELFSDKEGDFDGKFIYKYEYDNKNNWIREIYIDYDKNINVSERKIVYYGDKDENNYPEWDSPNNNGNRIYNYWEEKRKNKKY